MDTTNDHDSMPDGFRAHAWEEHGPNAWAVFATAPIRSTDGRLVLVRPGARLGVFGQGEARDVAVAVLACERLEALAAEHAEALAWPEDAGRPADVVAAELAALVAADPGLVRGLAVLAKRHLSRVDAGEVLR